MTPSDRAAWRRRSRRFGWFGPRAEPNELRFVATLPSSLPPLTFTVAITAQWHDQQQHPDPPVLVRGLLEGLVAARVEARSVLEVERVEAEVNWQLARGVPVQHPAVSVVGAVAKVTVSTDDRLVAEEHAQQVRLEAVARLRRAHELAELRYVKEHIFSDPGMARAWWLYKNPDKLGDLPNLEVPFQHLVETAGADTIGEVSRSIATVAVKLVDKLGPAALYDLVQNFARLLACQYDAVDLSTELNAIVPNAGANGSTGKVGS